MSVTLTLMPSASKALTAGRPSGVAGTLIITLGRATSRCRRMPSSMVAAVSWASLGLTSMLTRPSRPPVRRATSASRSHAIWMSSTAIDSNRAGPCRP